MATLQQNQIKRYCYVNSRDRIKGTDGNFTYRLTDTRLDKVNSFYVEKVLIPYSFFNISETLKNNRMYWHEVNPGVNLTYIIPDGQYTLDDLMLMIGNGMSNESSIFGASNEYTLSLMTTVVPFTGLSTTVQVLPKIQITATNAGVLSNFYLRWTTASPTSYLYKILGYPFETGSPGGSNAYPPGLVQGAIGTYNFNIAPNILIRSRILTANNNAIYKGKTSDVILSAPMASFQETLSYEPSSFAIYEFTSGSTSLNEFDLYLTFDDDNETDIDMQLVNWTAVIVFIQDSYV